MMTVTRKREGGVEPNLGKKKWRSQTLGKKNHPNPFTLAPFRAEGIYLGVMLRLYRDNGKTWKLLFRIQSLGFRV